MRIMSGKVKTEYKIVAGLCVLMTIALLTLFIYKSGGTHYSYTHIMYVPIIIGTFLFGMKGGILFALISGLALGPFMPENVSLGTMQSMVGWTYRTLFFIVVSLTVSLMLKQIKRLNSVIELQAYKDPSTGLPNINKFELDITKYIADKAYKSFTLLVFEFVNLEQISRYVDLKIGVKSLHYLLAAAEENFKGRSLYSHYLNEFVVVLPEVDAEQGLEIGKNFISKFKELKYINGISINFVLKCGVVSYPYDGENVEQIIINLGKVMGQVKNSRKDIVIFEEYYANKGLEKYKVLVNFYEAFKQDKLTLHYQPKIDLRNNKIYGVEALLRWKEPGNNVSTAKMIKIVEDSGSISELTKWVTEKAMKQLKQWHDKGIKINVSVNISAKDLEDDSIVIYLNELMQKNKVDSGYFEYEITERSLIRYQGPQAEVLRSFKDMGLTLSIDDYGTGYNSLMNMMNLPLDYIKIDKYFVDNICMAENMKLVQDVIDMVHNLGRKVCAEGVETKEQLEVLKRIKCDFVQGYYYSKAIPAEELETFIASMEGLFEEPHCSDVSQLAFGK